MAFFDFLKPILLAKLGSAQIKKAVHFKKDLKAMESKLHDCIAKGSCFEVSILVMLSYNLDFLVLWSLQL